MKNKVLLFALFLIFEGSLYGQESPTVVNIFPQSDSLPVNIMRFYVEFSHPMQEMNIYEHVHLIDNKGQKGDSVFYQYPHEFWNNTRTKVSLLVDPGRVKRGLIAHNRLGRAFEEGVTYHLKIDSLLLNFEDQPLQKSVTKTFVAITEDIQAPNVNDWQLSQPRIETVEPLIINLKDKIDHVSAQTLLRITQNNQLVEGHFEMKGDTSLAFIPKSDWSRGKYQLSINSKLEDLTANSVNQVFDHNIADFQADIPPYYHLTFKAKQKTSDTLKFKGSLMLGQ